MTWQAGSNTQAALEHLLEIGESLVDPQQYELLKEVHEVLAMLEDTSSFRRLLAGAIV